MVGFCYYSGVDNDVSNARFRRQKNGVHPCSVGLYLTTAKINKMKRGHSDYCLYRLIIIKAL